MPHKLTKTQKKKIILKCHLVFFYTTMNHFSIRLWCATKSGFYTDNQLSGWSEKKLQNTSQVKLASKRGHGQCLLLVWLTTAFCILAKPLHLRSMLSNLMSCTKNCNAFSWFWSTERALFFSTRMPNCTFHNQHFNSWTNWAMKFCLISYIHLTSRQMTTTSSSISDNLLQGKHFHNQ